VDRAVTLCREPSLRISGYFTTNASDTQGFIRSDVPSVDLSQLVPFRVRPALPATHYKLQSTSSMTTSSPKSNRRGMLSSLPSLPSFLESFSGVVSGVAGKLLDRARRSFW
jgi:hypothetical protein